jgi:amidase
MRNGRHTITSEHVIYEFTPELEARWTVPDGAEVEIHCIDGLNSRIQTDDDLLGPVAVGEVNAATGPIAIDGAMPGDALAFTIDEIEVDSDQGCTLVLPDFGLQKHKVTEPKTRISRVNGQTLTILGRFDVPIRPLLGTIGVAPSEGTWDTITPHDHGGNLDTSDVRAGVRLLLPVSQPGALIAMGDAKAKMGDGEICSTGCEVPVVVRGRFDVLKGRTIPRPMIETETEWMTIGSALEYLDACRLANADMIALLQEAHDLSWEDAYILTSLVTDLRISQVVDPLLTVRCAIPKDFLAPLAGDLGTRSPA